MKILLTGSVAFDYLMTFPGYFSEHILPEKINQISLSFLVNTMEKRRGGTAPNIAYTLALLGERPMIFATVGEDFGEYRAWLDEKGVDTRWMVVVPGVNTASFFVNTDLAHNQIASFYPGAMAHSAQLSLSNLDFRPDLVAISPSDPAAMARLVEECIEAGIPYLFDPSQQIVRLDADQLRRGVENAHFLFVNEYEFSLVQKKLDLTEEQIANMVKVLVVTLGDKGAKIISGGQVIEIPVVNTPQLVDPTGVGDAFRGGFLAGYSRGWTLDLCGRLGALAAVYCLEHIGSTSHAYSLADFVARFRQHFDDQQLLNSLLKTGAIPAS